MSVLEWASWQSSDVGDGKPEFNQSYANRLIVLLFSLPAVFISSRSPPDFQEPQRS